MVAGRAFSSVRAAGCARGRRPAREIATREPDGSEWSISRPALALPPPTGTATRSSGPSDALHTSGAGSLMCGSARRLEAWPGPSTAHGHRSQAHPTSESSHAKPLLGLRRSPPALTPLIPEPTRNFACNSPETISNLQFRSLELQRFQTLLELLSIELHATFRGQTPNTTTGTAAWPSPATRPHKREKTRPARLHQRPHAKKFAQHRHNCPKSAYFHSHPWPGPQGPPPQLPKISLFSLAGRTFSRFGPKSTPAGRVFSR